MRRKHLVSVAGVIGLALLFGATHVYASGFAIMEQSVRGLGTAFAGAAAVAEDPSTIFFNPAGMVRLSGKQVEAGLHYIVPKAEFKDKGSTVSSLAGGAALTGGDGDNGGKDALIPNVYYSQQLSDDVVVGLGIHAPFGLATEYDEDWVGRYHAVESKLSTINFNPSVAARVNDKWSVGAGFSLEYADATLSSKADLGLIGQIPGGGQQHDGFSEIEGDGWAYGFNCGLLFEPASRTRIGLAFRSSIHHKLDGDVRWDYETPVAKTVGTQANLVDGKASATVDLPETLSLAGYHGFNDKLAVVADITYTNWDRFDELRIKYGSDQPDTVVTTKWNDSWRYGLGLIYTPTDKCTGRIGVAYDQTPISSEEYRTPRIPDGDRLWVAVGAAYRFSNNLEINLGYTHIFVDDPQVKKSADDPNSEDFVRGSLVGEWDASVDIFSINASYVF